VNLRRVNILELLYLKMRMVICFADSQNILNRWKNYLCQLCNLHGVNDDWQTEMHAVEPLIPTLFFLLRLKLLLKIINPVWNKE
jgi:hypothetical protein